MIRLHAEAVESILKGSAVEVKSLPHAKHCLICSNMQNCAEGTNLLCFQLFAQPNYALSMKPNGNQASTTTLPSQMLLLTNHASKLNPMLPSLLGPHSLLRPC